VIRLENVTKIYRLDGTAKVVMDNVSLTFPPRRSVAILGRNGAGKSTMLRMISGTLSWDSGRIIKTGTVSWPVGFAGGFHGDLTGEQNTRFIARISGIDTDELVDYVRDFAELGMHFWLPVRTYSSGMRSRLSFGVSMGIQFDTYLVDEVTATGDATFKDKSQEVFRERLQTSGMIMVTHSLEYARNTCQHGVVLENGRVTWFDDIDAAIDQHLENNRRHRELMGRDGVVPRKRQKPRAKPE
jgi:capsular polysaccharide transport system ATP-binding protein